MRRSGSGAVVSTIALACAIISPARAALTGNELYDVCLGDSFDRGMCVGYALGVAEAAGLAGVACIPPDVTRGQIKDVVVNYLRDHPADRNKSAYGLVTTALQSVWPCH